MVCPPSKTEIHVAIRATILLRTFAVLWSDDCGVTHVIHQGEGGEQGDALMPMLYVLGQHGALASIQESLLLGEHLFAYHDDLYVVCSPERVGPIYKIVEDALEAHAEFRFTWVRRRCGTVEVTAHQGVALQNVERQWIARGARSPCSRYSHRSR